MQCRCMCQTFGLNIFASTMMRPRVLTPKPWSLLAVAAASLLLCEHLSSVPLQWQVSRVSKERTHHVYLRDGLEKPLYVHRFDDALPFHEPGLAPVRVGEDAWHIFPNGSKAYKENFSRTFGFYEGRAAVATHHRYHHILPSGQELYPERYETQRGERYAF